MENSRRKIETETATGVRIIRKNQAVLVLTNKRGVTYNGIILSTAPLKSMIRYNKDGIILESRIDNKKLVVVKCPPKEVAEQEGLETPAAAETVAPSLPAEHGTDDD